MDNCTKSWVEVPVVTVGKERAGSQKGGSAPKKSLLQVRDNSMKNEKFV